MGRYYLNYKLFKSQASDFIRRDKSYIDIAYQAILPLFEEQKNAFLRMFNRHDVTQELAEGPLASSRVLPVGNLFSFIGFIMGTDPIGPLRELLEEGIYVRKTSLGARYRKDAISYSFPVYAPSYEEVEAATPMPSWSNGSWVRRLERGGLNNLHQYLFDRRGFPTSLSGPAIQIEHTVNASISAKPISYVYDLLKEFQFSYK